MSFTIASFDTRGEEVRKRLERELSNIRTGKATPTLLDSVMVESYGSRVPIMHVGSVSVDDPRTLRISVWDQSQIKSVEKGIMEADLGLGVIVDGSGIRVVFPELTGERRLELVKLAKAKLEEARVSLRSVRDDSMKELDKLEKDAVISEDERFNFKELVQKRVDHYNGTFQTLIEEKEQEITR